MTEQEPSISQFYSESPPSTEQLLPTSASQQLYNTYAERISDFPGFTQLPFYKARENFEKSIIDADDSAGVDFVKMLLHQLVDAEAYENLKSDLTNYWQTHNLEGDLATYSYCFLTNHRFFSDLPIISGIMRDIRQQDPYSASRNIMVVGKMIPGMQVDIMGDGNPLAVTPLLSMEARQIQTVPKLPSDATDAMIAQRRVWNEEAKAAMTEAAHTPGNLLYIAASGGHDIVSADKKSLTMQPINQETAQLLCSKRLKVIPMFFSCDSFSAEGIRPAQPKYKLLPPRSLNHKDEVTAIMQVFEEIGSELLSDEFPKGVHYEERFSQRIRKLAESVLHQD